MIRAARLPRPHTNVRVGGHEVDFLWPDQRLIVEVDGFAFHATRSAFERDRARDRAHQAAGYVVLRITWRQLVRRARSGGRCARRRPRSAPLGEPVMTAS